MTMANRGGTGAGIRRTAEVRWLQFTSDGSVEVRFLSRDGTGQRSNALEPPTPSATASTAHLWHLEREYDSRQGTRPSPPLESESAEEDVPVELLSTQGFLIWTVMPAVHSVDPLALDHPQFHSVKTVAFAHKLQRL